MKKVLCVCLAVLLAMFVLVGCSERTVDFDKELVLNGNLENKLSNWTYFTDEDTEVVSSVTDLKNGDSTTYLQESPLHGSTYFQIGSQAAGSYGYYSQQVYLEKDAKYLLSCDVKVTSKVTASGSLGAFVGIAESSVISASRTETTDGWQKLEICFNNYSYESVNIRFGLGSDIAKVTAGNAYFDNISLKKITDDQAVGLVPLNLGTKGMAGYKSTYLTDNLGIVFTSLIVCLGALITYGAYVIYRYRKLKTPPTPEELSASRAKAFVNNPTFLVSVSVITAFVIRLILVITLYGQGFVLNELSIAAENLASQNIVSYYFNNPTYYTPGVTYLLYIFGLIAKPLGLISGTQGMAVFLKLPAIIADLIIVFVVYFAAYKQYGSIRAFIISLTLALVPIFFLASAVYASYLSVGVLFLLLAFLAVREKNMIKLIVFYSLSVLFTAESLWLLPLLLVYAVVIYIKNPETRNVLPIGITCSIIGGYLLTLPLTWNFFVAGQPFIVLTRYCTIFSQNAMFTDGAFNIYALCNVSGTAVNTAGVVMSAILAALIMLAGIGAYLRFRDRQNILLIGGYTMLFIYMFCVRMSVMIILPALLMLFLYSVITGERRVLMCTDCLAVISTVAACYQLMICKYVPGGSNAQQIAISPQDPVMIVFAVFALLVTLYLGWVVFDVCIKEHKLTVKGLTGNYFKFLASHFVFEKPEQNATDAEK